MAESLALMDMNLVVFEAGNTAEAFRLIDKRPAGDLAVVDLGLSRPAHVLLKALRGRGWRSVMAMTAGSCVSHVCDAISAGATGWLVDPCEPDARAEADRGAGDTALLSAREVQVIQMVAEGMTNAAIGRELKRSGLTVKSHLSRIALKLATGDRAEMVAIAMRAGLVK
ncbi:response regulator transcription factor [Lentzea roselyniae]|uniref:Response regulator transcription factor n=1 Tax=Lentzea roselyniae TaxID=531940 RepID=A0ABP7C8F9_9PSEU